jgi:hypothetical protein
MAHRDLPEPVLKSSLSDSIRRTPDQQQQETVKQQKIFSSYFLLLFSFFQASIPLLGVPGILYKKDFVLHYILLFDKSNIFLKFFNEQWYPL